MKKTEIIKKVIKHDNDVVNLNEQLDNNTQQLQEHLLNHPSGDGEGSSHTHSNLAVLNKINESDGKLTYDNKPIKSEKGNNWVNVVEYGIDNTGTENCTEAFQKLIDENTTVYVPNGIYLVDTLTIPAFHTVIGESWNALIKQTSTASEPCIKFNENACYSTLSNIKIQGVYDSSVSNRHGVYLPSYVNTNGHFDSFNKIENVSVTDISGDGIHINTGQRGGTFRDMEVARCVKAGFRIMGSDNYIENVNCAVSGVQGIVTENGGWNNRFVGCKAYHAGVSNDAVTVLNEGVDLMKIVANYCNLYMDLQENRWGALKVSGSANLMNFMIDGCGKESYNKSDIYNNAETSVITLDNGANNNIINAMYVDGTLNAFARYYLNIGKKSFENVFNLEFKRNNPADARRSEFTYLKTPCHHSNKININGQELVPLIYDSSVLTSINGNDGSFQWNVVSENNKHTFTSNKSFSTVGNNNWFYISLNNKFTNSIVQEAVKHKDGGYLYLSFDADSNLDENEKILFDIIVMMASPTGGTSFTDPTQRYYNHGSQNYSIPMANVKDDITEFNICIGIRNMSGAIIEGLPSTTTIGLSNFKFSFGDRITQDENIKNIAENVMNNLVGGAS